MKSNILQLPSEDTCCFFPPFQLKALFSVLCFSPASAIRQIPPCQSINTIDQGGYKEMSSIFAPSYERGGGGGCGVSANVNSCAHHVKWSPNKLWRSISIFNYAVDAGIESRTVAYVPLIKLRLPTRLWKTKMMIHYKLHTCIFKKYSGRQTISIYNNIYWYANWVKYGSVSDSLAWTYSSLTENTCLPSTVFFTTSYLSRQPFSGLDINMASKSKVSKVYLGSCLQLYSLAETPRLPPSPHIWAHILGRYWPAQR